MIEDIRILPLYKENIPINKIKEYLPKEIFKKLKKDEWIKIILENAKEIIIGIENIEIE